MISEHFRHFEFRISFDHLLEVRGEIRLAVVIDFPRQLALRHFHDVVDVHAGRENVPNLQHRYEIVDVAFDAGGDAGILNFDGDVGSVVKGCVMDLKVGGN